ncbi:MAG: acyl-CoA thioesterase [Myxococcota bacterium]|nr:acyl-CoA thioesterase [Myxococcota bacterium]
MSQGRPCTESHVIMTEMVLPPDTNHHGTVFGGRVLQWIDIAGAISARRHSKSKVVTASIDDMHFLIPIGLGDTVVIKASVNYTHRTSMEVGVRVEREPPSCEMREHAATAYLTFVAIDDDGQPMEIPPVQPMTDEEKRRFEDASTRRKFRLQRRRLLKERRG